MGATVAARNKKVREEALREQLRQKGLHTQVIEIANKLNEQYANLESSQVAALKASADIKMKLINKYMPDLKAQELTHDVSDRLSDLLNEIDGDDLGLPNGEG